MKVEVETDVLWPTRVKITLGMRDIWIRHDEAMVLRDQLISILKPVNKETLLEIARVSEDWK